MRNGNRNLVAKIDKVFLSKQDGDHEVCRGGARNIRSNRGTLGFGDENQERDQIGREYQSEYLFVRRKKVV